MTLTLFKIANHHLFSQLFEVVEHETIVFDAIFSIFDSNKNLALIIRYVIVNV